MRDFCFALLLSIFFVLAPSRGFAFKLDLPPVPAAPSSWNSGSISAYRVLTHSIQGFEEMLGLPSYPKFEFNSPKSISTQAHSLFLEADQSSVLSQFFHQVLFSQISALPPFLLPPSPEALAEYLNNYEELTQTLYAAEEIDKTEHLVPWLDQKLPVILLLQLKTHQRSTNWPTFARIVQNNYNLVNDLSIVRQQKLHFERSDFRDQLILPHLEYIVIHGYETQGDGQGMKRSFYCTTSDNKTLLIPGHELDQLWELSLENDFLGKFLKSVGMTRHMAITPHLLKKPL
jgi:hypothetical protein